MPPAQPKNHGPAPPIRLAAHPIAASSSSGKALSEYDGLWNTPLALAELDRCVEVQLGTNVRQELITPVSLEPRLPAWGPNREKTADIGQVELSGGSARFSNARSVRPAATGYAGDQAVDVMGLALIRQWEAWTAHPRKIRQSRRRTTQRHFTPPPAVGLVMVCCAAQFVRCVIS
jgi:hypothetical protein